MRQATITRGQAWALAPAIAMTLVFGSLAAVVRADGSGRSEVAATVLPAAVAPPAAVGRAPDDRLPLSDPQVLDLTGTGYDLPPGSSVYAARVRDGGEGPRYDDYVAGGGALTEDFWPASSIKVLAALGALDFVRTLGFTGAATVSFATGDSFTLREIYEGAVLASENIDYDLLIRIAGFDRLNRDFLSPANGFPATVIQRSYSGIDVRWSPEMTLEEDGRVVVVPEREGEGDYGCPDEGNCTNLFEVSEAVRRLVLDASVPPAERFAISPTDVQALTDALAGSGSFFAPGVEQALGAGSRVQSKPGVAFGLNCVDTAVVTAPGGDRYLLSAAIPDDDYDVECEGLSELAAAVLPLLASH